jgi:hypothetical protein
VCDVLHYVKKTGKHDSVPNIHQMSIWELSGLNE